MGYGESYCESIASVAKYYSSNMSNTAKIGDLTKLSAAGVSGCTEDDNGLILKSWSQFFESDKFEDWHFISAARRIAAREKAYPLGGGSRTLHCFRMNLQRKLKLRFGRFKSLSDLKGCGVRIRKTIGKGAEKEWRQARRAHKASFLMDT